MLQEPFQLQNESQAGDLLLATALMPVIGTGMLR